MAATTLLQRGSLSVIDYRCGAGPTDVPRFCVNCGRKLAVQVLPTGYEARCVSCPA